MDSKVLILTASVGAGHNSVARAVSGAVDARMGGGASEIVDILDFAPGIFRAYYSGGFRFAMSGWPRCYGIGYAMSDRPNHSGRGLWEKKRLLQEWIWLSRFRRFLADRKPKLVVNTHFLAPPIIARMIRKGHVATTQFVVITDNIPHRFWYSEEVDRWFLPGDVGAKRLHGWGIDPKRITVSGMPIHEKWSTRTGRQEILSRWALPADKKIVLLSGGAEFTCGPVVHTARRLAEACPDACVVVLAGRDKKLVASLAKLGFGDDRLRPVSYTDKVNELVQVASVMITKSGGITTSECIAEGLAMVLPKPVPGQESGNAAYLASHDAAMVVRRHRDVPQVVRRLLDDPQRLLQLGQNARSLYADGRESVAGAVSHFLDGD